MHFFLLSKGLNNPRFATVTHANKTTAMKTHNASTQSSILKITGDTSSNKLNLPQQQQQPQSIVSPISPTAEDVMSEARKNNVTVLAGLVDQLASRAQALVQCFMEVVKAQDLQLGSNTRPTQRENEKRKRLAPLWKAVYELCESIEATIPGYSNLSMEPYVYEVSKIVDLVSGQADPSGEPDGLVDVKTFEVCFPYFILKLLSTIKNSVKLYMDGEKAKKKSVVIDPAVLKQHFTDAMSNPMPAPHLRPQTQPPPQSSASTTITKTQQLFSVNPMPSLIPSDSSARVNSDFSNTTSIPALPSSSSSSKAIPKEPSSTDLSRQALDYVQKHAEVVRQLSVHAPPRKIESLEKLNNPTDKTATSNSVKKSTSHGRIAGTYEELHTSCDSLDKQQVTRTGGSTLPSKSESIKNLSAILVERKPSIKSASSSMPSRGKNSSENEVKQAWNIDASATISEKRNNIAGADQTITKSSSRIMLQSSSDPSTKEKMLRLANHNNRLQMPFVQNAASDSKKSKKTLSVLMEGNVRQAKEFFENAAIASSSIAVTSAAGNTLTKKPTINNGQQLPKTAKDSFSDRQQSSRDSSSSYSNTIDQAVDMVYIDNHSTLRLDYRPHVMGNGYIGANTTTTTIANATDGVFGARSGQHQQQTQEFSQFSQSDEYSEKVYVDDEEIAPSIVSVSVPPQVSEFLTKFGGSHPNSKRPSASAHSNTTTSTDHVKHRKKNGSDASVNTIVKELGAIDADKGPASVASEEEEEEDAAVKSTSAVMLAASSTITKPASFNPFTSEEEIVPLAASVKPDASAIPLPPPQALESHQTVVRRNRAQTVDQMIRHSIAPEEFYTQAAIANGYQIGDIRTSNNDQNTIKRKSMVADLNSWKASNFKTTEVGGQVKSRISRVFQPSVEDERSLAIAMENRAQKNINNYPTRSQPALYTSFSSNNNNENIYSGKNGVSSDDNNDDLEEFPSPSRPRMSNARPVAPTQSSDIRLSSANRQSVSLNNNRAEQIVPHSNMTENGAGSNDLISPDSLLQQQYQMYQQFEDNSYSRKVLEDLKLEESRKSSSQLRSNTTPLSTKLGNSSVASLSQISALQAVIEDQHTQVILIPLNGMFDLCYLNLSKPNMLGRSNTQKHARFKVFLTQVVSRSHVEMWEEDGKV